MPERLIEVVLPEAAAERVREELRGAELPHWSIPVGEERTCLRALVPAERVDEVLDPIEPLLAAHPGGRAVVLATEAVLPRPAPPEPAPEPEASPEPLPERISRSELYEDVGELARTTPVFLVTTVLATIVAAVGVVQDSPAVVIGAMVIAPLLGPNMALVLGTTLGDRDLIGRALRTNAAGITVALATSALVGLVYSIDPAGTEVASRTVVSATEVVLALATGVAGALAVTTGVAGSLVGVMVAVALLPPLVIASMLLVQGHLEEALGAYLLVATNVVCVNLSGVVTFRLRGIRPRTWWEASRARRATRIAMAIWAGLLVLVVALILVSTLAREAA
jgi:uncharacterized hydrophobic protein (TIGR00341 family)